MKAIHRPFVKKLRALHAKHNRELVELHESFVNEHKRFDIGDVIRLRKTIRIEKINYRLANKLPIIQYVGIRLMKNGIEYRNRERWTITEHADIKLIKKGV